MERTEKVHNKIRYGKIMIAASKSGSGKTMVTCGLLALLKRKGWNPAGFKCGPDYIDGLFHRKVLGMESGNLDSFFETQEAMREKLGRSETDHFVVVEGVMGYFDGLGGISVKSSTYEVASILKLPVILVVDARGASVSLAAQIQGFLDYVPRDEEGRRLSGGQGIAAVIFNRMSPVMYGRMKELVEQQLHVPVAGYIPELDFLQVGSRHLGLVLPDEIEGLKRQMEQLADCLEKTIDLKVLARISGMAGIPGHTASSCINSTAVGDKQETDSIKICGEKNSWITREKNSLQNLAIKIEKGCGKFSLGIAMDEAFCFYYRDNLEAMEKAGAKLVYFSPLHDKELPSGLDGLLLGGGYPENYARSLAGNTSMRKSVADSAVRGMPILGECGGYLYLLDTLESFDGVDYPMAGVLPGRGFRGTKKGRFGYITLQADEALPFVSPCMEIKAHEFHYWDCGCREEEYRMWARKPVGNRQWRCMRVKENVMAGFPHLYYPSCPEFVKRFADSCVAFGKEEKA